MPGDIVRVLRLVEYVGQRDVVEEQVARSIHGTKVLGPPRGGHRDAGVRITVITLGEFPESLERYVATTEAEPFGKDDT